jgi:hypothetical protein
MAVSFIAFTSMARVDSALRAGFWVGPGIEALDELLFPMCNTVGQNASKLTHDVPAIAVLLDFLLDQDLPRAALDDPFRV